MNKNDYFLGINMNHIYNTNFNRRCIFITSRKKIAFFFCLLCKYFFLSDIEKFLREYAWMCGMVCCIKMQCLNEENRNGGWSRNWVESSVVVFFSRILISKIFVLLRERGISFIRNLNCITIFITFATIFIHNFLTFF